jgi:DNA-damage-inducible protein J
MGYNCRMSKTATIRARVEPNLKSEVEDILERLGLSASETIQLLYRQIQLRHGLPFEVRLPTKLTALTLRRSKKGKGVKRFTKRDDFYRDLGL